MERYLTKELKAASLSMFSKNFVGIFHGSISAKVEDGKFIINSRDSVFDHLEDDDFIELYTKKDYRWTDASIDADIHLNIYQNISEAKYISYTMAPFMTAYAMKHESVIPKDYFGNQMIGEIPVYDPGDFNTWYTRAQDEVYRYFSECDCDMMLIRGYGLYTHSRDLVTLIKKIAILENSCKILNRSHNEFNPRNFPIS
jgi:L-fuculose-phosphate aldolase